MIKQMRASYFHNFKNAQYCALSNDPIPDYLENGDQVYIIDQGKIYYWDESSSSLYEYKGGGGGGSGGDVTDVQINGTSILSDGVANIPIASSDTLGAVMVGTYGIEKMASGMLRTHAATTSTIKGGVNTYDPVVPTTQHASAFYGLAKAAGDTTQSQSSNPVGTYTDEAKAAIKSMLGVADGGGMNIVNLSGTQITQVGADNTFYVCGELTELTFTAPAVGITMIRFTSGTTPTVLTVNGVTAWMFDFDPTVLEANTTYDISVLNGIGVAGWA